MSAAPFLLLATLAEALSAEGSRLRKRDAIAAAVGEVHMAGEPGDAGLFCLYLAGMPFAEADARRLHAGGAILSRVLAEVSGAPAEAMTAAWRRHGDLGASAFDLMRAAGHQPQPEPLSLKDVADVFDRMARASSTRERSEAVHLLLSRASALEAKYLLKLMLGDMRIGVKQSLVEEAVARCGGVEVALVRHAVMLEADLARAVARTFAGTLGEARMTLFHPLGFMLASPVETPEEAIARFTPKARGSKRPSEEKAGFAGEVANDAAEEGLGDDVLEEAVRASAGVEALIEDKFDGIRAQLHFGDPMQPGRVALYSRSREEISEGFPEIVEAFAPFRDGIAGGLILDGELMAWDVAADRALPFALLGQRIGRKRVENALRRQVPVVFLAFDVMSEGGELLLPLPLAERRQRLEHWVEEIGTQSVSPLEKAEVPKPTASAKRRRGSDAQGELFSAAAESAPVQVDTGPLVVRLRLSRAERASTAEGIDLAYRAARARANEGVMIKAAQSPYVPGRRGLLWVKLKRELGTLDVVITGAEYGTGRRAQLLSDYTFAVRGAEGHLLNVGKAYSGVTDAEILELTAWLKDHTLEDHGHFRTVEPIRVLEVAFNNIMRSDRHSSGFALRFPRIVRLREDKPVEEIDTLERVEEIFQSQPDRPSSELENL